MLIPNNDEIELIRFHVSVVIWTLPWCRMSTTSSQISLPFVQRRRKHQGFALRSHSRAGASNAESTPYNDVINTYINDPWRSTYSGMVLTSIRLHTPSRLTYWGRDKMVDISQMTLSNAFSWMKIFKCRLKCQWNSFLRVQLAILNHWFR